MPMKPIDHRLRYRKHVLRKLDFFGANPSSARHLNSILCEEVDVHYCHIH
jgi:hypothetical protein